MSDRLDAKREAEIRSIHENAAKGCEPCELLREIDALRADLTASQAAVAAALWQASQSLNEKAFPLTPRDTAEPCVTMCDVQEVFESVTHKPALAALDTLIQAGIDAGIQWGKDYQEWLCDWTGSFDEPIVKPTPESVRSKRYADRTALPKPEGAK